MSKNQRTLFEELIAEEAQKAMEPLLKPLLKRIQYLEDKLSNVEASTLICSNDKWYTVGPLVVTSAELQDDNTTYKIMAKRCDTAHPDRDIVYEFRRSNNPTTPAMGKRLIVTYKGPRKQGGREVKYILWLKD